MLVSFFFRNVSRLAQEYLLKLGITLIINTKESVLEKVSRFTQADIVTSVDAHISKPQLGTCQLFYLKTYQTENGWLLLFIYLFSFYKSTTFQNFIKNTMIVFSFSSITNKNSFWHFLKSVLQFKYAILTILYIICNDPSLYGLLIYYRCHK